jgi:hypothetical protein
MAGPWLCSGCPELRKLSNAGLDRAVGAGGCNDIIDGGLNFGFGSLVSLDEGTE